MNPQIFVNLAVNKVPTRCGRGVNNIKLYVEEDRAFSTSDSKGDCGLEGGSRCLDALADTTYYFTFHANNFFSSFLPRNFFSCFSPHPGSTACVWVKMLRREVHSPLFSPIFSLSRGSQNH